MTSTTITTVTGRTVMRLRPEDVCIEDIAHGLACTSRFGGQAPEPVTVAQHSVVVSRLCPNGLALAGLLHDAAEAYVGDVIGTLKRLQMFCAYRNLEERVMVAIMSRFGCPLPLPGLVRAADRLALRVEARVSSGVDWVGDEPYCSDVATLTADWRAWSWREAEEEFMDRFVGLVGRS